MIWYQGLTFGNVPRSPNEKQDDLSNLRSPQMQEQACSRGSSSGLVALRILSFPVELIIHAISAHANTQGWLMNG